MSALRWCKGWFSAGVVALAIVWLNPGLAGQVRQSTRPLTFPLILEAAKSFDEPYDWDASGMKLRTVAGDFHRFEVTEVVEGAPAAEAGVRPGDVITAVDGKPGGAWTLWQLECLLKKAKQEHVLAIDRAGARQVLGLRTRPLI